MSAARLCNQRLGKRMACRLSRFPRRVPLDDDLFDGELFADVCLLETSRFDYAGQAENVDGIGSLRGKRHLPLAYNLWCQLIILFDAVLFRNLTDTTGKGLKGDVNEDCKAAYRISSIRTAP